MTNSENYFELYIQKSSTTSHSDSWLFPKETYADFLKLFFSEMPILMYVEESLTC